LPYNLVDIIDNTRLTRNRRNVGLNNANDRRKKRMSLPVSNGRKTRLGVIENVEKRGLKIR